MKVTLCFLSIISTINYWLEINNQKCIFYLVAWLHISKIGITEPIYNLLTIFKKSNDSSSIYR